MEFDVWSLDCKISRHSLRDALNEQTHLPNVLANIIETYVAHQPIQLNVCKSEARTLPEVRDLSRHSVCWFGSSLWLIKDSCSSDNISLIQFKLNEPKAQWSLDQELPRWLFPRAELGSLLQIGADPMNRNLWMWCLSDRFVYEIIAPREEAGNGKVALQTDRSIQDVVCFNELAYVANCPYVQLYRLTHEPETSGLRRQAYWQCYHRINYLLKFDRLCVIGRGSPSFASYSREMVQLLGLSSSTLYEIDDVRLRLTSCKYTGVSDVSLMDKRSGTVIQDRLRQPSRVSSTNTDWRDIAIANKLNVDGCSHPSGIRVMINNADDCLAFVFNQGESIVKTTYSLRSTCVIVPCGDRIAIIAQSGQVTILSFS
jgi:hypothetical protein